MRKAAPSQTRQRIGPVIRQLRAERKMSLGDLAETTGISVSYLSRLEKGRSVPSFTLLSQLSDVLGKDISYFVGVEHDATATDNELRAALEQSDIPEVHWDELFELSLDARKAMLAHLTEVSRAAVKARKSSGGTRKRSGETEDTETSDGATVGEEALASVAG